MSWKPKYFIIYPYKMINELTKPENYGYLCAGNLSEALRDTLNVKSIGSEIKLIWNNQHRWQLLKDYELDGNDLDDYIKSECSILSFKSQFLMKRAIKQLKIMGAKSNMMCVDNYRDVIIEQAHYKRNGSFSNKITETKK